MQLFQLYALQFVGRPYHWGGEGAWPDCSGFVQELLKAAGADLPGDQNAQAYYDHFSKPTNNLGNTRDLGALAFYGASQKAITHIAMIIDRKGTRVIEAGGGTSRTKTEADAIRDNAFIRIRPILHRSDLVAVLLPEYSSLEAYE